MGIDWSGGGFSKVVCDRAEVCKNDDHCSFKDPKSGPTMDSAHCRVMGYVNIIPYEDLGPLNPNIIFKRRKK